MYKIIAHPGSAHKDDFMSVSVLLAILGDAKVFRREPTSEELADPDTYVVDVGMEYTPDRNNFDHHQDPSLPCAFHLVMQHLGHHDAAMSMFVWYPHMSMMDVRGPYQTAEHLGIDSSVLFASSSPIDGYILSRFSRHDSLEKNDLLYEFMKALGQDMLALIERKMKRLARLKLEAQVVQIGHLKAITSSIDKSPKLAMELYLRHLNDDAIVMSITPSVRGAGWELLRLGDNRVVDFLKIKDYPEVSFVHANGFLAKTEFRLPLEEVIQLASHAVADFGAVDDTGTDL
ncbi:MYG1 family protein [Geopsychrobacter electrodiphilus]|uniref:MYG1 family protein n=1 Tax=Geopsychrobacter electrodiphilus TaxID=225196 RepID=UPI00038194DA|nr:MYG1 family protein [Geopsychrobacter electrodiphilus]